VAHCRLAGRPASYADWNNRQTFGDKYYDLPGHNNPIQQELERHQSIITTGWDPVLGISRGSVGIEWATSATSTEEEQKRAVTQALLQMVCAGNMTVECAEQVYGELTSLGEAGLEGGNYNFKLGSLMPDMSPCMLDRCGFFNSLHFNFGRGTVHLATANPYIFPVGSLVHLFADYILGHTIWTSGIPR
jgi:hypothetical protein